MNKSITYYASAFFLAFLIFLILYSSKTRRVAEKKKHAPKVYTSYAQGVNFEGRHIENKNFLSKGEQAFTKATALPSTLLKKELFSCKIYPENASEFCFFVEDNKYETYLIKGADSLLYSTGTFFKSQDEGKTVYTFASREMSTIEGFYRYKTYEAIGVFYQNVLEIDWYDVPRNKKIIEAWRLVEDGDYFRDSYSKNLFSKLK